MIPWEFLDSARVPGTAGELHLYRRGNEFSIRIEGYELMNSRVHASEEALAELACARVADRSSPRVLIGGLGMGFTLAAALSRLVFAAQVVVAELVPTVVEWNRGVLAGLAGNPLEDDRVTVCEDDVASILKRRNGDYDVVILDIDNGPEGLTRRSNDWLYSLPGLNASFESIKAGGVLAVWSASPERTFGRRLKDTGFRVNEVPVRARGSRGGAWHTIWIAERVAIRAGQKQ